MRGELTIKNQHTKNKRDWQVTATAKPSPWVCSSPAIGRSRRVVPRVSTSWRRRTGKWLCRLVGLKSKKKMVWQVWLIDLDDLDRFLLRCCFQTFWIFFLFGESLTEEDLMIDPAFWMWGCDPQSPSRRRTTARQAEGPLVLIGYGLTMDFSIM